MRFERVEELRGMIAAKNAKGAKVDWKTVKLGEVSVDGGHYGIGAPAVEYDERLPTYLRITDIRDDGSICKEGLKSVDSEEAEEYYLKPNDLVIARTGASTGRNYFYDGRDGNFVYAGFLIKFSIDENKIWPPYVKYWFKGNEYRSWLNNHTDGSTRANINAVTLAECPIRVPEALPIQRKIAAVLGAIDDKIENNRKICANLEAQAQALFKSWFVDFEPFGGKMPEGWKEVALSEIADYVNGLAMQKYRPKQGEDALLVLKIKELRQGYCDESSEECTANISTKYVVDDGDVVFSWSGSLLVDFWCGGKVGLNQHLFKVVSDKYSKWFVYSWTKFHLASFIKIAADKATTMGHITREHLEDAKVFVPSDFQLKALGEIISPMYDKVIASRIQSRALAELRDALLPRLMSGEIDVSEVAV